MPTQTVILSSSEGSAWAFSNKDKCRSFVPLITPTVHFLTKSRLDCRPFSRTLCILGQ